MLLSRLKRASACLALALGVAAPSFAADPVKIGFVYLGPTGDHGWTFAHDQGRKALEAKFSNKIKTTFVENVPETADSERVFRQLAMDGNKVIFGTSFGYMNQMVKVAKEYPGVIFEHSTGYKTGKNLGVYNIRHYQSAYLAGVLAGKMSKTGKLGFVGSIPIPEVLRNINAFTLGARSVNPKITTRVIWVNGWFDPGKEREAALSLISQGADVLLQNTDSPAVVQAAQDKGVYAFGWDSDMAKFGPKAHLAAAVLHWGVIYDAVVTEVMENKWKSGNIFWGIERNAVDLENYGPMVPAEAKKLLAERRAELKSGKLNVFAGPLKNQAGAVIVPAGKALSDADLVKVNYYVEGVEGALPK